MDYVEGIPLEKLLREKGAQPQETVLEWSRQLCRVLDYLHGFNPPVIYRDLKPSNMILQNAMVLQSQLDNPLIDMYTAYVDFACGWGDARQIIFGNPS